MALYAGRVGDVHERRRPGGRGSGELSRSAFTEGDRIRVEAKRGVVTLEGTVASWVERGAAVEAAYQAGANTVVAHLSLSQR